VILGCRSGAQPVQHRLEPVENLRASSSTALRRWVRRTVVEKCCTGDFPLADVEGVCDGVMATAETGQVTGTADKDYNLIWFAESSLSNGLRMESYVQDAERSGDDELAEFFRRPRVRAGRARSRCSQRLSS
jgi:hypothetical protein